MPRRTQGSVYRTATGYGIRWPEDGRRPHRAGFATKTEARRWFAENVAPRLDRGAPSAEISFDAFCELFLARHGATVSGRTRETLEERLKPARATFGSWALRELKGGADDIARWRSGLRDGSRYRLTSALRQVLGAAVRWHYIGSNPAVEAGRNPQPRSEELLPFTPEEIDALEIELGPSYGPLVVFAAETGLRTNEWVALERRDVDRPGRAIVVARRARPLAAPARHPAPVPGPPRRAPQPRQLADPRVGPGARRRRAAPARPLPAPPHLCHRGARGRSLDLRAGQDHGDQRRDDRPHLRTPGPRLRGGDPGSSRREGA
jgi:integrase